MNLGAILAASARHHPDRTAVIWDDGRQHRTYKELNRRADALAAALVDEVGVRPQDRVAIMMANGPELLETLFAVWKAAATVVPLNARYTEEEIVYHVGDSEARVLIAGEEFAPTLAGLHHKLELESLVLSGDVVADGATRSLEDLVERSYGRSPVVSDTTDDDVAWLAYTSGTTGRPKGAMLTHGNLTFVAVSWLADLQRLEPEDVGLVAAPLTHGAGMMALAFVMKAAAQVILQPSGFDTARFLDSVSRFGVTHTWLVPTQIRMVLDHPGLDDADLSTLKTVVYGGAPMYVEDLKEAIRRIGPVFVQLFAQSESPMTGTYLRPAEHILDGPGSERLASCGHARSGTEVAVLDDKGAVLAPGETGEICIRCPAVMKGYWKRPDATAETLRDGWLHTGDVGKMDDQGYVFILDRTKDMLISGGLNVYPREIEEVLLRHAGIAQAAVIGVPDDRWGEAVKAIVVPAPGARLSEAEVIAFAGSQLAGYKKPKSVDFVTDLPKTTIGKIDKKVLRAPHWTGRDRQV